LLSRPLSTVTGFREVITNVGELTNKGIEVAVNATVLDVGGFRLEYFGQYISARNKVTKTKEVRRPYTTKVDTIMWNSARGKLFLGESVNSIYAYKFEKIAQASDMDRIAQWI